MEGSESEAVFDALDLNPQLFLNEVLNSVDDIVDGAFGYFLQRASEITSTGGDTGEDRSEELARGVSSLRHLTQGVLDKRLGMWEKYCLTQCFSTPEGFILPKAQDSSSSDILSHDVLSEQELDSQLDSLRKKLAVVGKESADLQSEIRALEKQFTLSSSFDASLNEALQVYDNSAQEMLQEIAKTTLELQRKMEAAMAKSSEEVGNTRVARIFGPGAISSSLEDIEGAMSLENIEGALSDIRSVST